MNRNAMYNAVYWELYDPRLKPEDVYDIDAMCEDDEPGLFLRDLMREHVKFPERNDALAYEILKEICMQAGIRIESLSYDDIIIDLVNINARSHYILSVVK